MSRRPATTRITAREKVFHTPWVRLVRKTVEEADGSSQDFYAVDVLDYAAVCPRRPDGRFVLVRQFRPAVERYVWEFPSGTVEPGEAPEATIRRELVEETGHVVRSLTPLGSFLPDVGRLDCSGHLLFAEAEPLADAEPEAGIEVGLFEAGEIDAMIADGRFPQLQHVGLWLMARARGLIEDGVRR